MVPGYANQAMSLNFANSRLQAYLPGANELMITVNLQGTDDMWIRQVLIHKEVLYKTRTEQVYLDCFHILWELMCFKR